MRKPSHIRCTSQSFVQLLVNFWHSADKRDPGAPRRDEIPSVAGSLEDQIWQSCRRLIIVQARVLNA
jgi:hypothetical protein